MKYRSNGTLNHCKVRLGKGCTLTYNIDYERRHSLQCKDEYGQNHHLVANTFGLEATTI